MIDQLIDTFFELVRINSSSGSEKHIRAHIINLLRGLHIQYEIDDYGNLLACINCSANPPLVFACHLDTVAMAVDVHPTISEDFIQSDGKSGLGADDKIAVALLLNLAANANKFGPFGILFTVEEEIGLKGAKHLSSQIYSHLSKVFIFDTGRPVGTAIVQAPCKLDIQVSFHGKAAHAGVSPEQGISAISISAEAISKMKLLCVDDYTTANIGSIHGSGSTNVVCDRVDLEMEIRSQRYSLALQYLDEVKQCCIEACNVLGGSYVVNHALSYEAYKIENSDALNLFRQACESCSIPFMHLVSGGGSDVNILRHNGIDAVLLGAGYKNAHSVHECISLVEIEKMLEVSFSLLAPELQ